MDNNMTDENDSEGTTPAENFATNTPDAQSDANVQRNPKLVGQYRGLKPFTRGDVRINRKGRPKVFNEWRDLVQDILQEPAVDRDKSGKAKLTLIQIPKVDSDGLPVVDSLGNPVMVDHYATNAEMLARKWLASSKRQQDLIDAGFGKVPYAVDVTSGGQSLMRQLPDEEKLKRLQALAHKALTDSVGDVSQNIIDAETSDGK
jgi:hypothetical protein